MPSDEAARIYDKLQLHVPSARKESAASSLASPTGGVGGGPAPCLRPWSHTLPGGGCACSMSTTVGRSHMAVFKEASPTGCGNMGRGETEGPSVAQMKIGINFTLQ